MFQFEVNETVIVEQQKALEAALSTNPKTQSVLRRIIRKFIQDARKQVIAGINFKHGDPRGARNAVRTTVYKKILGANINIFDSRKAHGVNNYVPPRKGATGRGGNRRKRSDRTMKIMSYAPLDRGFILRWLNAGTPGDRNIEFTHNERRKVDRWNKHPNTGNRGNIQPRNFFRPLGDRALGIMRDNLAKAIEEELATMMPHD